MRYFLGLEASTSCTDAPPVTASIRHWPDCSPMYSRDTTAYIPISDTVGLYCIGMLWWYRAHCVALPPAPHRSTLGNPLMNRQSCTHGCRTHLRL